MSFVLSRMAACGGTCKNKVTVSKPVWDFLSKETPARLARLREEHRVSILIDGETSDIYVLQLSPQGPPPAPPNGLYLARKALKGLLKEAEKELKKAQRQGELMGCLALGGGGEHPELHRPGPPPLRAAPLLPPGARGLPPPPPPLPPPLPPRLREEAEEQESTCPICLGEIQNAKTLEKCRHSFCEGCITRALQVKKACPMCGRFYGQLVGNQPQNGRMLVSKDATLLLPSYEKYGTIVIQYVFPPGVQGAEHPNPGVRYPGTTRVAYLPDCPEGNKVLTLFRKAFDQRLTFTIGTSMTTGRPNVITWNDIHHKTSCTGGPQLCASSSSASPAPSPLSISTLGESSTPSAGSLLTGDHPPPSLCFHPSPHVLSCNKTKSLQILAYLGFGGSLLMGTGEGSEFGLY
ncbi:probable E3 ubiquitin-protein ligase DTX3 isoform X2 [Cricetulus griseus]|uniref:E3 ubiquitin-protein ligase n=2 Tax=Cricetulus griseus TaxID=10029 RepID=A0A9J7H828_CRIGR|nr:probable E3 ubiquitin-protein ligase DTX3 isoform X2 [Cricetulus griseus]XP_027248047.1 probable E3 ubiquitin-protein ligase DTX3 isoform X2 [Cricetulus griseus]XP_027248048.1 probable E3 ubiquitin-protein ligase DTX3 isoform X1 [Cricetulus griseus]XP_027295927.1 probable E3 ubiquitin-protein ligase DTX3 isoform X1 [Cricetulus griseus]XP_027295928.1 probable E3 ubiquitin-protein ligase DTX3 isoform X1 [Cricetulus griseus]XP_035306253.1 probable E3 ubiquitin-protein ligase DTX3 isoform X1 [C